MLRPQRIWRVIFGPYPVDTAYQWRGTPIDDGRPFLRLAHFGDCTFREMPLSHGIHTPPGYPRVLAERLGAAGLGMEFSSMMVASYEELPQTPEALTAHLKLTGEPDVVVVQTAAVCTRLELLPSTHEILRMREDVGRALGRHVFTGYRCLRPVLRAGGRFAVPYEGAAALGTYLAVVKQRWPHARVAVMPPLERTVARRQQRLWARIQADAAAEAAAAGVTLLDCHEVVPAGRPELRCANGINVNAAGSALVGDVLADWVLDGRVRDRLAGVPEHQLAGAAERGAGGLGVGDEAA